MSERPLDTTPEAHRVQRAALADLGPAARFRAALEMSESVRRVCLSGLRRRHPDATPRELAARFAEDMSEEPPERAG